MRHEDALDLTIAAHTIYSSHILHLEHSMRTLVDLPESQLANLTALSVVRKTSRVALIREAIDEYLKKNNPAPTESFGLWGLPRVDGLEYQKRMRDEW